MSNMKWIELLSAQNMKKCDNPKCDFKPVIGILFSIGRSNVNFLCKGHLEEFIPDLEYLLSVINKNGSKKETSKTSS